MFIYVLLLSSCNKEDSNTEVKPPINMGLNIIMVIGVKTFTVSLYDNSTAKAFLSMLPLTLEMGEMNGNEKYYDLPKSLPSAAIRPQTIHNGNIMLYGSRTFVLFYETFSTPYSYTQIGQIDDVRGLKSALGTGNVIVKFELE